MSQADRKKLRMLKALNTFVGVKGLDAVVKWREFRQAAYAARLRPGAHPFERLRSGVVGTARNGRNANLGAPSPNGREKPGNEGFGRFGRQLGGIAPVAGNLADGVQFGTDANKLVDEFGLSTKTARNSVATVSSGLHNVSNVLTPFAYIPPVGAAALVTEGVAWGGDIAVLGYDLASNPDQVVNLVEGAGHVARGVYQDPVGAAEDVGKGIVNAGKGLAGKLGL
jgi:hypothetical protein